MKIAIVAPRPDPPLWGGTERAVESMRRAAEATGRIEVELIKLPVDESNLPGLIDAYRRFAELDVSRFDRVISVKYPAWMVDHPDHVVHMFHPLRGLYDAYETFGLPLIASPHSPQARHLLDLIGQRHDRRALQDFFVAFEAFVSTRGPDDPDLVFPGPFARAVVHWLDRIALTPPRTRAHFAISATVAARREYFPDGIRPLILPLPTDLPLHRPGFEPGSGLFTASRLHAPKRLDLLIDAMAHVDAPVHLSIAGSGPEEAHLRARAAGDPRIEFLGFLDDEELIRRYRDAIAVPFVPDDEDQGLICVEAASQGTPTVTCTDSGGPTEFVVDGVNGLVAAPSPEALGRALQRIAGDPVWARRMGHNAFRRATTRTWADVIATLVAAPRTEPPQADRSPGGARSGRAFSGIPRRPKALVLATYGIDHPGHGGQLRVHHLCRALAETMDVEVLALVSTPGEASTIRIAPGLTSTTIPRAPRQATIEDDLGILAGQPVTDILAGVDAHLTPEFLEQLSRSGAAADLVVLAQPFLHPALDKAGIRLPYLVDTQNVEIDLRAQSLGDSPATTPLLDTLRRVEGDALRDALAVSACSRADADRLTELYGLTPGSIAVIPNGTTVPDTFSGAKARARAAQRWISRFRWNRGPAEVDRLGVFFGSWHPPNLDAAEFLVELAGRRRDLFIVSAGNHGSAFADRNGPPNIVFPGVVSEATKHALFAAASVALNPMRIGSGTNLKLIEFLGHGVPTVTTPFGARGLTLTHGHELLLAEPEDFDTALDEVFTDADATDRRCRAGWEFAKAYDWRVIGTGFRNLVGGIVGVASAA